MAEMSPVLSAEPFAPGLLGAAQPPHSLGVCLLMGLYLIRFPSWMWVLERALGTHAPAWNWALTGPCCEFRIVSKMLPAWCLVRHGWQWAELLVSFGFGVVWVKFVPRAEELFPGVQKAPGA